MSTDRTAQVCAHVKDPMSICRKRVGITAGGVQSETQKYCTQGGGGGGRGGGGGGGGGGGIAGWRRTMATDTDTVLVRKHFH